MAKQIKNKEIKLKDLSISKELALRFESGNFIVPTDFESWNLVLLTEFITENYAHNDLFEELKKQVFSKYHVPSSIDKHKLSPDVSAALKSIGFYTLNDIFSNRKEVYSTFSSDSEAIEEINNLFSLYSVEPLSFLDGLTVASDALGNLPLPPESLSPAYHEIAEEEVKEKEISVKERIDSQLSKEKRNRGIKQYSHFKIRLASSNEIKLWSYGEVTNHNTINYRTGKPEEGGLFCEKIFGPTKDYECNCGKKNRADKETVCPKCGIEITESKVRRERMGHIHLSAPVVHTWYLKNNPYILRRILKFPPSVIDAIVSRKKFIIIETSTPDITLGALMDEQQYAKYNEKYKGQFKALTGAEAIAFKLKEVDLAKESAKAIKILESSKYDLDTKEINMYRKEIKSNYINQTTLPKEISQIIYFDKLLKSDNKLEWMVLNNIPVIPPDLRPMVALDGGRYATTGLNDLYRKIINRNIRLKKMIDQNSPSIIINNEKRMIQQSVDELFLPSEKNSTVGGKKVKAISEYLRGKEGIMRQNLLGKRVDYSARSVIIVGPDLEMHQCGLPRDIAVVLFKPFIIRELNKKYKDQEGKDTKTKNTSKIYDALGNDVWEALEKVVKEHPVLLNRAPTLHRLSIQAFEPKLIDGKAIRLHPLVCTAFNADFDGDQMAVHLPLSNEAQAEARLLMLASNNILNLKDGKPVVIPTQDMVLGNYYLTIETPGLPNEFNFYSSFLEAERAYEDNIINLHTRIVVDPNNINSKFSDAQKNQYLVTTFGKLKFNAVLPNSFPFLQEESKDNTNLENGTPAKYFINKGEDPHKVYDTPIPEPFKKSYLGSIISEVFKDKNLDLSESSKMLDRIKDLGFKTSTIAGFTISIADINVYKDKKEMIDAAEQKIRGFEVAYDDGELTTQELNNQITRTWSDTQRDMGDKINKDGFTKENHIFMMKDSGARGSASNFNQLAGMRGAMGRSVNLNYKGARLEREKERAVIKIPVKNSFREGINVSEFFNSTYGGRKGSTDTALKTANSGYFTRRFVDVAQDIVVVEDDCNTDRSEVFEAITTHGDNGKVNVLVNLKDRILGRYTARDVINEQTGEVVVPKNTFITDSEANLITDNGISKVEVRTVFTCNSYRGVCAKCYGKNLATNNVVEIGEAVGVIAGQSIGEPSTQLTMRTFHTGGVASESDITQGFPRLLELLEGYNRAPVAYISDVRGVVKKVEEKSGIIEVEIEDASASKTVRTKAVSQDKGVKTFNIEPRYLVPRNTNIIVKKGDKIYPGTPLTKGPIMAKELTRADSTISSKDYIKKEMLKLFRSQKIEISDKHIEIIIRQMYNKLTIFYAGDTDLVPGSRISIDVFKETNAEVFSKAKITEAGDSNYKEGEIVYRDDIDQVNLELEANGKAPAKFRLMEPATAKSLSMGIKMASRQSDSLLSAVSFEDSRIGLTKAAIEGKTDYFYGLKENAMIGGLIPAGTGIIRDTVFEYDDTNAKKTE